MTLPGAWLADLSKIERQALGKRFCAVFAEGYPGRVPRDWGDNHGVWPMRLRTTAADPRQRARNADYDNPVHGVRLWGIWWFENDALAGRVHARASGLLAECGAGLKHAWHDLAPERVDELVRWAATVEGCVYYDDATAEAEVRAKAREDLARRVRARF